MRIELDIPLPVDALADMLGAAKRKEAPTGEIIRYVSTDTRELGRGDLFFALGGDRYDGEDFVATAKSLGAYTVSAKITDSDFYVDNTNAALLDLANAYKRLLNIRSTVAITGSVGKTTTKNITLALLSGKFSTHGTYKNLNNEIGVPLTVLSAKKNTEVLVIEAGMNHKGELCRISRSIEPDVAVITCIGTAHIGNLGSIKGIAEAKEEILCGMKRPYLLAPKDDPYITKYSFLKSVSVHDKSADFCLYPLMPADSGFYGFRSRYNFLERFEIRSNAPHIPTCLAFALSVCSVLNMSDREILDALSELDLDRFEKIHKIGRITVIDDSYNCSPESARSALNMLKKATTVEKSAVFGDMLELGEFSEKLHFELGEAIADAHLSHLYLFGHYAKDVMAGAVSRGMSKELIFINENTDAPEITAEHIRTHSDGGTVLLKGSRMLKLERILEILKEY